MQARAPESMIELIVEVSILKDRGSKMILVHDHLVFGSL